MQNFGLSIAHVKFHQIYTLIGSFCWKYKTFQLQKYRGVMSHDTEDWCKIWRKTICHLKSNQNLVDFDLSTKKSQKFALWLIPFMKKNITFDLKKYRRVIFHDTKIRCKIEEKLTCGLENDIMNLANFHQKTFKSQIWNFDGILLSKIENAWAKKLQRSYV